MLLGSEGCLRRQETVITSSFPIGLYEQTLSGACTKCLASVTAFWISSELEIVTFIAPRPWIGRLANGQRQCFKRCVQRAKGCLFSLHGTGSASAMSRSKFRHFHCKN
jgi:hypothetical protein